MAVTVCIPSPLRQFTDGKNEVEIAAPGKTIAEVLAALWEYHPGLRDRIVTERGTVREHVNLFVNEENIRHTGGLATAVTDGAQIYVVPAISGGCGHTATATSGPTG